MIWFTEIACFFVAQTQAAHDVGVQAPTAAAPRTSASTSPSGSSLGEDVSAPQDACHVC